MNGRAFLKKVSVIISCVAFVVVFATLLFVAYPLQMKFGNIGLVATELLMLAIAVIGCVVTGQKFSEVFPIKLPGIRNIFGAILMWGAMYIMSMVAVSLSAILMPERFFAVSTSFDGMPIVFKILTIAILAPICEEAVHRGLITHFLKPIKRKWIIMLIIGIQFGLLHWEPVKFLSTAIAGACMAYVLLKTKNIILCVFMHFLTNLPAALVSTGAENASLVDAVSDVTMQRLSLGISAGVFLFISAVVPWLLYAGSHLLSVKGVEDPHKTKKIILCTVFSIVLFVLGVIVTAVSVVLIVNMSIPLAQI